MTAPPVVCLDLGNVLVKLCFPRCLSGLERLAGRLPTAGFQADTLFGEGEGRALALGQLAPNDFVAALAARFGIDPARHAEVAAAWCSIFEPWPEMAALTERVLAGPSRVWLLSNTDPLHMALLWPQLPFLARFDGLWLSYQARRLKPDPDYFKAFLASTGLQAADCLFVDDRIENVEAARALGVRGHVHSGDVGQVEAFLVAQGVTLAP